MTMYPRPSAILARNLKSRCGRLTLTVSARLGYDGNLLFVSGTLLCGILSGNLEDA